ncbi:peptide MFS transporter [Salinispora oceanensis]|uniref:peptide MFS transporter n=1 Tax=Salinispora oceanensis TaxID=1050199 RepID=UPI00036BE8BE|nr:oligopeptide:H+ symporter [Salinispora oceanensis]
MTALDSKTVRPEQAASVWSFFRDRRFTTLFVTDLWERFSFYGMQALLFLYAVAPEEAGGLGLDAGTGGAVFGLYMSTVFIASLPGGWVGDRLLGPRRALLVGAVSIALGHYVLAIPVRSTFYLGLLLVAIGTGLVKPNLPVLFSVLWPRATSSQREAAFSVFYMSIQVSALIAPLVTGLLGEKVNWHLGFGAAAVGMTIGVLRLLIGLRDFGADGLAPTSPATDLERRRVLRRAGLGLGAVALLFAIDVAVGTFSVEHALGLLGLGSLAAPVLYFRYLLRRPEFGPAERARVLGYVWVLIPSGVFWMLFSQLGSTFSLFAREETDRRVAGWEIPASWFQSLHPLFLLLVAPLSAWLWVRLGNRTLAPIKLAGGLLTSGLGFVVMAGAAAVAAAGVQVSPWWLVAAFFAQACGELTFGPVGLSVTAEIAPPGYASQMMGLYFLGAACGAGLGGQLSRLIEVVPQPAYFGAFAVVGLLGGLLLAARGDRLSRQLGLGEPVQPSAVGP